MPSYDYRCNECSKRSIVYQTYEEYGESPVECPHCGSNDLRRIIGRIRIAKSEDSRLEDLSDPSGWDFDESDPKSMAKMMRKMGSELGEDMPAEFDEVVDRLESGEDPENIEKDMPDLAGGDDLGF